MSMQAAGVRDVTLILKQVTTCSLRQATRLKKSLDQRPKSAKKMSPDQAFSLYVDTKLSKNQYNRVKGNSKKFHDYNCYPPGIVSDEISAEVSIQALVDHTLCKLSRAQENVLKQIYSQNSIIPLTAWFKWGCDGAARQS
ncbi:uncharacterized protein TNCV_1604511 [Trichonephila clavipes]|nr:uncharacterized protein TNCV_1604511 [Trichonephila clavipes]